MSALTEQLFLKLGLSDEDKVKAKTTELLRLIEVRASKVPAQVNDYGKVVLCADIATDLLDTSFDKEQALKISGLRKSHYENNKRIFEMLLNINRILGVRDICIKLNINESIKKAEELLDLYRKIVADENSDIDINHPQYASMAVFQACKLLKIKINKTKLMPFSNLRPTQWVQLEQRWDKFIGQHYKKAHELDKLKTTKINNEKTAESSEVIKKRKTVDEVEDYTIWKERMLTMARKTLEEQQLLKMNKENIKV